MAQYFGGGGGRSTLMTQFFWGGVGHINGSVFFWGGAEHINDSILGSLANSIKF